MNTEALINHTFESRQAIEGVYDQITKRYLAGFNPESEVATKWTQQDKNPKDEWLAYVSRDLCALSSAYVINSLLELGENIFEHMVILRGRPGKEGFTFLPGETPTWHSYFLLKDSASNWYAGSPANYVPDSNLPSTLDRLIVSPHLEVVLGTIQTFDGGEWTDSSDIQREIDFDYLPPIQSPFSQEISIMTFDPCSKEQIIFHNNEPVYNPASFVFTTYTTNFGGLID